MSIKKLPFIIVSSVILIFIIMLAFILNEYSVKPSGDNSALYIVAKVIAVLLFTIIVFMGLIKKDLANYVIIYISTIGLQFLPLVIRYLSLSENGFLISVILFFIVMILYFALIGGLVVLSKKTITAEKKLEGETIQIRGEHENEKN